MPGGATLPMSTPPQQLPELPISAKKGRMSGEQPGTRAGVQEERTSTGRGPEVREGATSRGPKESWSGSSSEGEAGQGTKG